MIKNIKKIHGVIIVGLSICFLSYIWLTQIDSKFGDNNRSMIEELKFPFFGIDKIPDPNSVNTAAQWYFLDHITSSLVRFNHEKGVYQPLIAESWEIEETSYTFHISKDAKFSDGSSIRSIDIAKSVMRLINKRTVTHFPLWEYIEGCNENLESKEICSGIQIIDDRVIRFKLTSRKESFFLALSSPEVGIWSEKDIDEGVLDNGMKATKFSGPYIVSDVNDKEIRLKKNQWSLITKKYEKAPNFIVSPIFREFDEMHQAMVDKRIDLFYGEYMPFSKFNWEEHPVNIHYTTPSTLFYLLKNKKQASKEKIGRDLLLKLWEKIDDPQLIPADTFLPPGSLGVLDRKTILDNLPETSSSDKINVASIGTYFKPGFHDTLSKVSKEAGVDLNIDSLSKMDFVNQLYGLNETENWDYNLSVYVASERYPAVQLYFMLYGKEAPTENLFHIDDINADADRRPLVHEFERLMVKNHYVIPLFFVRSHIVSHKHIDIGRQSETDSVIHLWEVSGAQQ